MKVKSGNYHDSQYDEIEVHSPASNAAEQEWLKAITALEWMYLVDDSTTSKDQVIKYLIC